MSPLQHYQALLAQGGDFQADPEQEQAVLALDRLYKSLVQEKKYSAKMKALFRPNPVRGIYLWGGVGRGKTFLMDLFFQSLPDNNRKNKVRFHFHRFMHFVHDELKKYQGKKDPLAHIARIFSKQTKILCFDEFHVVDIADAMILSRLIQHLLKQGLYLVMTSNLKPGDLYANGLQRDKFLPTIALLEQNLQILALGGTTDYRLRFLRHDPLYYYPHDQTAEQALTRAFEHLAPEGGKENQILMITQRALPTRRCASNIVWFEFQDLCQSARSAIDYIEIARSYHTVLLSHVPQMHEGQEDVVRRFIILIDEFYDRRVKLIMSAEVPLDKLYQGERLAFEFQRTGSRLTEMQSVDYLAKSHLS